MISIPNPKPLVFSCSGCTGSAQMANYLAVKLDKLGKAEMPCIAGIGGQIKTVPDIAGRIAGIINHAYIEKWNNRYMRFGWIDFEEDENIAHVLLHEVENWEIEKKMTAVHGPLGFTNFDYAGTLVAGYDQPGTYPTIYNHPYYPPHIESSGYRKDIDWVEYKIKTPESIPEKMKLAAIVVEKRYKLRVVKFERTRDILPYGKAIFGLLNSAYENSLLGFWKKIIWNRYSKNEVLAEL